MFLFADLALQFKEDLLVQMVKERQTLLILLFGVLKQITAINILKKAANAALLVHFKQEAMTLKMELKDIQQMLLQKKLNSYQQKVLLTLKKFQSLLKQVQNHLAKMMLLINLSQLMMTTYHSRKEIIYGKEIQKRRFFL